MLIVTLLHACVCMHACLCWCLSVQYDAPGAGPYRRYRDHDDGPEYMDLDQSVA